jgi:hypothetical protein
MSLSGMNLVRLDQNYFVDAGTQTTFEFLFGYEVSDEEADRRIYAYFRWWKDVRPDDEFYGRPHTILQTGKIDPPQ